MKSKYYNVKRFSDFSILTLCGLLFLICNIAEEGFSLDNHDPKNAESELISREKRQEEKKSWKKDLRNKLDNALDVIEIIKEDIDELEETEGAARKAAEEKKPAWGENLRNKIDKSIKAMKIIKEDIKEIERLEERKVREK